MDTKLLTGAGGAPRTSEVNARLRVLHLSSGNLYGGVERIISALAEFRGLCPDMTPLFGLSFDGRQARELRVAGAAPHLLGEVRLSRPFSVARARRALRRVLDEERPNVVVCHNPWPLVVFGPAAARRGIPVVAWVHGALAGKNWLERLSRRMPPNLVIANSHFSATTVQTVFPAVVSKVVYAPAKFPRPDPMARARIRGQLGAPPSSVVVLQVSRMEPGKGHELHLAALANLRDDPSWTAWFAGGAQQPREQRLMRELQTLAADLGVSDRVRFLGERTDVYELLAGADVFCQPNLAPDTFGLAFVEALAAGLPVVTTAIGGALEIVDESCGILVPRGDEKALAAALARLFGDAARRSILGGAGPARAEMLCDPATRLEDLNQALCEAVALGSHDRRGITWSR